MQKDILYTPPKTAKLDHLFGSKTRVRLLSFFLKNKEKPAYVREISRKIDAQINAVRRELENLESLGIICIQEAKEESGQQKKYYVLDHRCVVTNELSSLFMKSELMMDRRLFERMLLTGDIIYLALTGFFTDTKDVETDILIVGDNIDKDGLVTVVKKMEKIAGREINFTTMQQQEFYDRKAIMDRFLSDILESKKIVILDTIKKENL